MVVCVRIRSMCRHARNRMRMAIRSIVRSRRMRSCRARRSGAVMWMCRHSRCRARMHRTHSRNRARIRRASTARDMVVART